MNTADLIRCVEDAHSKIQARAAFHKAKFLELETRSRNMIDAAIALQDAMEARREAVQQRWNLRRLTRDAAAVLNSAHKFPAPIAAYAGRVRTMNQQKARELARDWINHASKVHRESNGPGVYALFKGEELVYVGKAGNVAARIPQHLDSKDFDAASFISAPANKITEIENFLIRTLKPRLNSCAVITAVRRRESVNS